MTWAWVVGSWWALRRSSRLVLAGGRECSTHQPGLQPASQSWRISPKLVPFQSTRFLSHPWGQEHAAARRLRRRPFFGCPQQPRGWGCTCEYCQALQGKLRAHAAAVQEESFKPVQPTSWVFISDMSHDVPSWRPVRAHSAGHCFQEKAERLPGSIIAWSRAVHLWWDVVWLLSRDSQFGKPSSAMARTLGQYSHVSPARDADCSAQRNGSWLPVPRTLPSFATWTSPNVQATEQCQAQIPPAAPV